MTIHVDLNATVLSENRRAFLARPGPECRYFDLFREMCAIGPDLPYMELERGLPIGDHVHMEDMLKRSAAFRRWRWKTRYEDPPSEDLSDYRHENRVRPTSSAQFRLILRGYFEAAKLGDLALVPPSAWQSDALLIEFSTGPGEFVYRKIPYGEYLLDVPVRKFREIGVVPKRLLPLHILGIVTKPNGFVQFGKSDTADLHEIAYDSFIKDNEYCSTFHVGENAYSLEHDLLFAVFVKVVVANSKAISESLDPLSIEDAFHGEFGDYTPTLQSNVNSPGWLRLKGSRITPLLASALFSLAVEIGPHAVQAAENGMITVGNSKAPKDDACVARVHKETLEFIKFLRLEKWAPACELARKVSDRTGMHSQSTISQSKGQ